VLRPGTKCGPYEIVTPLGEGGMGVVYEAEDTRLGRRVALKFLPAGMSNDPERRARLEREARTIATLNHPHICTLFDVGEQDGASFLVMERLEGDSLRTRVAHGRLPVAKVLDLAIELADALEAAHAKGIVHRDIKPENVFVTTRGTAKLLDFGIASLAAEARAVTGALTVSRVQTGAVALGTLAYMSPEQVRGEGLDGRTDLFSLGVVLYELLTGAQPFRGATSGAVISEILTKVPTAPVRLNADVWPELERIVNKLLEKDRELRFQSARDVRVDLDRLRRAPSSGAHDAAAAARPEQPSIVVLPFENLSPDPENAFFADGLTEEVIADLSKVRAIRVISRTSAMLLKGAKKDLRTIGREMNVRYVLEGSVRRAGSHLRITAQLIDATTDAHLWAEKYSGTLDDVFDLQEQLSRRIVEALKGALTPDEERRLAERPLGDVRAFDCYLRARQQIQMVTATGLEQAMELTDRAIAAVGDRALLHATRAIIQWQYVNAGIRPTAEQLRAADASADAALRLDGNLSAGWLAKGYVAYTEGRLEDVVRYARHAVQLDGNSDAYCFVAYMNALADRIDEARRAADQAIASDPLNSWALFFRAYIEWLAGDLDVAIERFDGGARRAPGDPMMLAFRAVAIAHAGNFDEATVQLKRVQDLTLDWKDLTDVWSCALAGDQGAVCAAARALEPWATRDKEISWHLADCLAAVGRHEDALAWLGNSIHLGFVNSRFLSTRDPFLAPLRGGERFEAIMDKAREGQRVLQAALAEPDSVGGAGPSALEVRR
jgi:eukaryotic-like serine/threonine-protein kinase